jgi:hypothetical protein
MLPGHSCRPRFQGDRNGLQFGYLDLGKRKTQRVLAVRATERAYLDLPVYGGGIVAGHGRTEIARCEG